MITRLVPVAVNVPYDAALDPATELVHCQNEIRRAGWWKRQPERWPLGSADAAEMLSESGQFDIDIDRLIELVDRKLIPSPGVNEDGGYEWSAIDIHAAAGILEARLQWRPTPSGHDAKKHVAQLAIEAARNQGIIHEMVTDQQTGTRYDARHLLVMMARCDQPEGRANILALIFANLEVEHGLKV